MPQTQEKKIVREALGLKPLPEKQEKSSVQKNIVLDALFNAPPTDVVPGIPRKIVAERPPTPQDVVKPELPEKRPSGLLTPEQLRAFGESVRLDRPPTEEEKKRSEKTKGILAKPIVSVSKHIPDPDDPKNAQLVESFFIGTPLRGASKNVKKAVFGGLKGGVQALEGLTTPTNIALIVSSSGASAAIKPFISLAFAGHMGYGLGKEFTALKDEFTKAIEEENFGKAAQIATNTLATVGFITGAAAHGGKGFAESIVTKRTGKLTGDLLPREIVPEKVPKTVKESIAAEKKAEKEPEAEFEHFQETGVPGEPDVAMFTVKKEGLKPTTVDAEQLKELGIEVPDVPVKAKPVIEKPKIEDPIIEELKPTSIKNAQVDKELEVLGLEPATHGERLSFEQARQEAAAKIKKDPQAATNLVNSLVDNPRPISAIEDVVLLHEQNRLRIERVSAEKDFIKATKSGDKSAISTAEARIERARDDFQILADVVTKAGTASSLALGHRRIMLKEDYSLASMERAKTVANDGKPLSRKQEAEVRTLHEKINKIEEKLLAETARATGLERQLAAREATGRELPRGVVYGSKNSIVTIDRANKIRISLKERLSQLNVGVDPIMLSDMTQLGVFHVEAGTRNFTAWSKRMTVELGNRVKPHLKDIWKKANITFSTEKLIKKATAALERSIAEYERRISEQDIFPKERGATVTSPALEKLRERRDALKKEFKELRDELLPEEFKEEKTLKAFRTRTKNQIANIKDKLFKQEFSKPERKVTELGKEELALKFELDKLKRKFNEGLFKDQLAKRSRLKKLAAVIPEAINTTRAIITSIDLSAVLRQGAIIGFGHPIRAVKVIPAMIRALLSKKKQFAVEEEIRNRDNFPLYKRSNLYLSEQTQKLSQMEEVYMSRWAEHIPLVAASQRAYTTFLNKLRADSFDAMAETLGKNGKVTPEEAKVLANFINVSTGRGKLGQRESAAVGLNTVFFAPRFVASRFQFLALQPFFKGNFRTRKLIATEYARFITGLGVVYGLSELATDTDIEWDPRSSDFGKIRFGKTRVDPMAGMAQVTTFGGRLISGETKRLKSGKIVPIRGEKVPFGATKSTDVMARFLRSKLSPVIGTTVNIISGENFIGEPTTPESIAKSLVVPIAIQDILDIMIADGVYSRTVALSLLAIFGMGLQTHKK